jgi:hypothetical protein
MPAARSGTAGNNIHHQNVPFVKIGKMAMMRKASPMNNFLKPFS